MKEETKNLYGLDEPIILSGRSTTIREQKQIGNAREMRVAEGGDLTKNPLRHFVTIEDDAGNVRQLDILEADFKILRGEP